MRNNITWKHLLRITVLLVLAMLLVIGTTACGMDTLNELDRMVGLRGNDASKTQALFESITEETGIHMEYTLDAEGVTVDQDVYKKGDNFYAETTSNGQKVTVIITGETMYALDDNSKTAVKLKLEGEQKEQIAQSMDMIDNIYSTGTSDANCQKGSVKIDGVEYETEEYSSEDGTAQFVYNDDGKLTYLITDAGDEKLQMKISAMDGEVPDSRFELPEGYTVNDMSDTTEKPEKNEKPEQTEKTEKQNDTEKKQTEDTRTVTSYEGGYSFQARKSAIVEINGQFVDVYLEEQSTVPYYRIYPMMQVNNQTVDSFLNGTIQTIKKNQKDQLLGEPEKVTITVNDRELKGFTYSYTSDDGKRVVVSENFAELHEGTIYSWGSAYMEGDSETPAEFRAAIESFQLK